MLEIFISYKWETKDKNDWVEKLYTDLRTVGFNAKLDKYEVPPGGSFSDYMTKNISRADHMIFIVTDNSKKAVESGYGALAFEMQISNARKLSNVDSFTIIPILREGNKNPTYLADHRYLDFREDTKYHESFLTLIKWLNNEMKPPKIGYSTDNPTDIIRVLPILRKIQVTGWGYEDSKPNEKGTIRLSSLYDKLEYTSAIDTTPTSWWKHYYQWDLVWDDLKGVVLEQRMAISAH